MSAKNEKNNIVNFYQHKEIEKHDYPNPHFEDHQFKIPFYALVCAPSGSGKSNFTLNLIQRMDKTFSHIYILTVESEPLYELLQKKIKKGLTICYKLADMPSLNDLAKNKAESKLIIIDDMQFSKAEYIPTLYARGRKMGVSTMFLAQSFYNTDRFIRKQLHYLILLNINGKRDINAILSTYNFGDIDPNQLIQIFKHATKEKFHFLKINITEMDINKKFSHNFSDYYTLE